MRNKWIAVRTPGNVIHVLTGTRAEVEQQITTMNEADKTGQTSIHSGPFTEDELRDNPDLPSNLG